MIDEKNFGDSGSFVLHAMDVAERSEFEHELADSEALRTEVTELADTAVLLGMAVDPVTPSPSLKLNIMALLSQTPQREREEPPVRAPRSVAVLSLTRVRWYRRPAFALVAAAAVALIVGGFVATNVALEGAETSARADALTAITTASDVRHVQSAVSTGGTVTLVWSPQLKKSALIAKGLRVLPGGKTYELWYITAGSPTPAGLFESNGGQTNTVLNGRMAKGTVVGVTIEPSGGSKAPTSKPVVAITPA